ncbi:MAG: DUF885 family protein, partial [Chitinophagaceae bacterium]
MRKLLFFFFLSIFSSQIINAQSNEASLLSPLITQYQADENMFNRKYALKRSDEYFKRMSSFYADWLTKLKALPFEKLTANERIDYLLLKRDINADQRTLKQSQVEFASTKFTIPFDQILIDFEQKRRIGKQQNGAETATKFKELIKTIDQTAKDFENSSLKINPVQANWAQQAVNQHITVFTEAYKFYDGYDPQFTKETKSSYPDVLEALKNYAKALGKSAKLSTAIDDGSGIIGNPIGGTAFSDLLKDEMIAYTPAQIEAIAMKEFAWCDAEMIKASQQMGFGNDWKKALEKVKTAYPELGKQPELVYELANEAINFVEENKLITVPQLAKEGWRMRMLSPQEQQFAPFFLGGESVLIAYPTEDM